VVKEYIAARTDYEGMVVISETAGAASELSEAVIVNPNDIDAIAKGIQKALDMPRDEKIAINKVLHERIKRYNVSFWASEFLTTLDRIQKSMPLLPILDWINKHEI
jgi:trehalose 6-phosphate synthase/phosphatase